jgi:hypothetical protein
MSPLTPALLLASGLGVWLWLQWLLQASSDQPFSLIEANLYGGAAAVKPPEVKRAMSNVILHTSLLDGFRIHGSWRKPFMPHQHI